MNLDIRGVSLGICVEIVVSQSNVFLPETVVIGVCAQFVACKRS
jgi:hypothetical protein